MSEVNFRDLPQPLQDCVTGVEGINKMQYKILKCKLVDNFAQCFVMHEGIIGIFSYYEYASKTGPVECLWLSQNDIAFLGKQFRHDETALNMWRKGGSAKTEAKAAASRENGKLGGRPRKVRDAE